MKKVCKGTIFSLENTNTKEKEYYKKYPT